MNSEKLISFLDNYKNLSREKVEEFLQAFENEIAMIQGREVKKVIFNIREPNKLFDILFADNEELRNVHCGLFNLCKHTYQKNETPPILPYDKSVNDKFICLFDVKNKKSGVIILNDLLKAEMAAYFDDFSQNKVDFNIFSNKYDKERIILEHDFVDGLPYREDKNGEMVVDSYMYSLFNKRLFEYEAALYFFAFIDETIKTIDDFYNNRKYILEGLEPLFNNEQSILEENYNNVVPFKNWQKESYQNSKEKLQKAIETKYTKQVNCDIAPEIRVIFDNIAKITNAYFIEEKNHEHTGIFKERMKERTLEKFKNYYMYVKEFI